MLILSLSLSLSLSLFLSVCLSLSLSPCFTPHPPPRALIAGGGAPEIEVALRLMEYSQTLKGMEAYCVRAFAEAMEVIPSTLAENAGLNPISVVTELRKRHANGERTAGINVRKVRVGPSLSLPLSSLSLQASSRCQVCSLLHLGHLS